MLAGRSGYSTWAAKETVKSIQKDYLLMPGALGNYIQYIYMTPVFVNVRFGNWDDLLSMPPPDPSMVYANILYHFGRGMAFSNQYYPGLVIQDFLLRVMQQLNFTIRYPPLYKIIPGC